MTPPTRPRFRAEAIIWLARTIGFAVCTPISFALLTYALLHLEFGPAYAVWTGIGAARTALVGMALLGQANPFPPPS